MKEYVENIKKYVENMKEYVENMTEYVKNENMKEYEEIYRYVGFGTPIKALGLGKIPSSSPIQAWDLEKF